MFVKIDLNAFQSGERAVSVQCRSASTSLASLVEYDIPIDLVDFPIVCGGGTAQVTYLWP